METASYEYAFHGLHIRDMLLLKSMIDRALGRISANWKLGSSERADCVFYKGSVPPTCPSNAVAIQIGADTSSGTGRSVPYPLRLPQVAALVASLELGRASQTLVAAPACNSWHQLTQMLLARIADGSPVGLLDAEGCGWVLHPAERQFTFAGHSERAQSALCESKPGSWRLIEISEPVQGRSRHALELLLWYLGSAAGSEGLLPSIDANQQLRLRVWPYLLTRAPKVFGQLASQLRQGGKSAAELQSATQLPQAEVAAFINACWLCGFLVPQSQTMAPARAVQLAPIEATHHAAHGFTRFFGAIRQALGIAA